MIEEVDGYVATDEHISEHTVNPWIWIQKGILRTMDSKPFIQVFSIGEFDCEA